MAIKEIKHEGKVTYVVTFNLRSKNDRRLRAQRRRGGVETRKEAIAVEKELIRECAAEIAQKENTDISWEELLERWELAHRFGKAGTREIQADVVTERHAFLRRMSKQWLKKGCHEISPGDVRRVIESMEDDNYSHSRLRNFKSSVNVVFRWGIEQGQILTVHHSPALDIELRRICLYG